MWLHVGTHWLVLADPMFSGQKPFCDIGKNNPVGACPPIGTIYFGPNSYIDVAIPDNQRAIGVQTYGFSWSKGDYSSGAVGAPQGSVTTAQLEPILLARLGHSEEDVLNRYLFGYLGY